MAHERWPRWSEAGSGAPFYLRELLRLERLDAPGEPRLRELAGRIATAVADPGRGEPPEGEESAVHGQPPCACRCNGPRH